MKTSMLLVALMVVATAAFSPAVTTTVDEATGASTTKWSVDLGVGAGAIGAPKGMRVVIVDKIAQGGLQYKDGASSVVAGSVTHAPQDIAGPGGYNYGFEYAKSTDGADQIMATAEFSDTVGTTGAYAVVYTFSNDPTLPGMFGCQVDSNVNVDTITLDSFLLGDGDDTEYEVVITVSAPATNRPRKSPSPFKVTQVTDAKTGEQQTTLTTEAVGMPKLMRAFVVDTAAQSGLQYDDAQSSIVAGTASHAPQDICGPGGYNYGYEYAKSTDGADQIMATAMFRDTVGTSGAYISAYTFSNDPSLPNMFGVQVNSNANYVTVNLESAIVGDGADTEGNTIIYVSPPARKPRMRGGVHATA